MFADYHVHSEFSDDSAYPLEEVVKDAIRLKLDEICITDHVDYGVKQDWDCGRTIEYRGSAPLANVDYPRYMDRIDELKKQYGEQITIKTGMELSATAGNSSDRAAATALRSWQPMTKTATAGLTKMMRFLIP